MLHENEGSGKDQFMGDPDLKCNTIQQVRYLRTIRIGPSQSPLSSMRRKKLAGSRNEIASHEKPC